MKSQGNIVDYYLELLADNLRQGYFFSLSSPSKRFNTKVQKFPTTFTNALIMLNLMGLKSKNAEFILNRLNKFLLNQKTKILTFNYWAKNSKQYIKIPYPDDLDDTFTALTAIHQQDVKSLSGSDMRKITELLVHQEAKIGGPYYTWVYQEDDVEWKDIDIAVNSNVAFFLTQFEITLPNIVDFIEKAIIKKQLLSKYYPQSTPVGYFISKWYKGKQINSLIESLETKYSSAQSTFLDKLLIATALLNYEKNDHPIVIKIYKSLNRNPEIANKSYPFYRGVNPFNDGKRYYAGSPNLTISFAVEFLSKYQKTLQSQNMKKNETSYLNEINVKTFDKVRDDFLNIGGDIKKFGLKRLNILEKNPDMALITSVPFITQNWLNKHKYPVHILKKLSAATLYGWLAYDVYDDFFDREGSPPDLSVANFALRQLTDIFTSEHFNRDFKVFFHEIMNIVDQANARESDLDPIVLERNTLPITKKVFNQYRSLNRPYEKSFGHVLGIMGVYFLNGYSLNSKLSKDTINFFKHYLSARQLIDDMHDWEEDLTKGKINLASAEMIRILYKENKKRVTIDKLRLLFWEEAVIKCCSKVTQHINQAMKIETPFMDVVKPFQKIVDDTLMERQVALEFLK